MLTLKNKRVSPETYIQLPGKKPPSEIYGGTWRAIYDEDSVFFRTPGFLSNPMNGTIQGDAMRDLTGNVGFTIGASYGLVDRTTGVFGVVGTRRGYIAGHTTDYNFHPGFDFKASRVVPTSNEFRPRNITVRLWELVV